MSRGQSVILDFVLAAFIFSLVFFGIMMSHRNVQKSFSDDQHKWRIEKAATQSLDMLVKSRGLPVNWENPQKDVIIPGLRDEGYELSDNKVRAFDDLDYEFIKSAIGLEGFEYKLTITTDKKTELTKGSPAASDFVIAATRMMLYKGDPAKVRLVVWEEKKAYE